MIVVQWLGCVIVVSVRVSFYKVEITSSGELCDTSTTLRYKSTSAGSRLEAAHLHALQRAHALTAPQPLHCERHGKVDARHSAVSY
eukprot:5020500-Pleurochrysis_carterae.AAC.2